MWVFTVKSIKAVVGIIIKCKFHIILNITKVKKYYVVILIT